MLLGSVRPGTSFRFRFGRKTYMKLSELEYVDAAGQKWVHAHAFVMVVQVDDYNVVVPDLQLPEYGRGLALRR